MSTFTNIVLVASVIVMLNIWKPSLVYKPTGEPREFGFGIDSQGHKKTLFQLHTIVVVLAVVVVKLSRKRLWE